MERARSLDLTNVLIGPASPSSPPHLTCALASHLTHIPPCRAMTTRLVPGRATPLSKSSPPRFTMPQKATQLYTIAPPPLGMGRRHAMPRGSRLLLRVCPSHFYAVGEYRYYLYLEVRLWREIASPRGHKELHALAPSSRIIRDSSRLLSARRG